MLHPRLPTYPFIIIEVPTEINQIKRLLTLLGDIDTWSYVALHDLANNANSPRDLILNEYKDTFLRTRYSGEWFKTSHKAITAKGITRMLTATTLYKRG